MRIGSGGLLYFLAGSLAFTAADDMKLIVQAYEMQNEQGQESYQAESKSNWTI